MKQTKFLAIFLILLVSFQMYSYIQSSNLDIDYTNFPEVNMITTPESGVLVDIDTNNFFYDRFNFPPQASYSKKEGTGDVMFYNHNIVIDKALARLKVTVTFGDLTFNYDKVWTARQYQIVFGQKEQIIGVQDGIEYNVLGGWYHQYKRRNFCGYIYNVQPGTYQIKLKLLGTVYHINHQPYIGTHDHQYVTFEYEGEFLGELSDNKDIILPKEQSTRPRKYAGLVVGADDYIQNITTNGTTRITHFEIRDNSLVNWVLKKRFDNFAEEGSKIDFSYYNYGGPGSFIATIGYYDRFGGFRVISSNRKKWYCSTSYQYQQTPTQSGHNQSQINILKEYKPMDYKRAEIISYSASVHYEGWSWCGTVIPTASKFKPMLYLAPFEKLTEVTIGDKKYTYNKVDFHNIIRISSDELKPGVKITIKTEASADAGVMAVVYYKDKDGKVVELPGHKVLKCTDDFYRNRRHANYRLGGILAAINPAAQYYVRTKKTTANCSMTLPDYVDI